MRKANLDKAKAAKKDEFYTQLPDIERELNHEEYRAFFSGKVVYCSCDDFRHSQFYRYFADNFHALGLKKLIATGFPVGGKENDGRGLFAVLTATSLQSGCLEGNGDFRSPECIAFLRQADVVVTNPPFSLFREYVAQLMQFRKKFVILGNKNAVTYKEIFPLIKENKIWTGYTKWAGGLWFVSAVPGIFDKEIDDVKFKNTAAIWLTNIPLRKYQEELPLYCEYSPELYPRYDNYDAIEVSKTARIPVDYFGVMGVPITFLDKYNPEQFEIVGKSDDCRINGKSLYKRLFIRRRKCPLYNQIFASEQGAFLLE